MEKKISVIVPIYNVGDYVEKCLISIINQTYKNMEIICIDDGSTDSSGAICDQLLNKDDRIKVIHQKNQGLSASRNNALDIATGDYISFIDSDDWIEEDMFSLMVENLEKNNADISICNINLVDLNGNIVDYKGDVITRPDEKKHEVVVFNSFIDALNDTGYRIRECVWNKLYKRELWDNIRFPVGKVFEDIATLYFVFEKTNIICSDNSCKYNYLLRDNSIIHKFSSKNFDMIEALINRYEYLKEKYPALEKKFRKSVFNGVQYILNESYESGKFELYDMQIKSMIERVKVYPTKGCDMQKDDERYFDMLFKNYKAYRLVAKLKNRH